MLNVEARLGREGSSPRRDRGRQAPEAWEGHLRPAAARAPLDCGRQPAARRILLVRLVESSPSRRFTSDLLPAGGALQDPGRKLTGSAVPRHPSCLRSGRGEADVTASYFRCCGSVRVLAAMPSDEEDESPFVGLLQVEAA